MYDSSLFLPVLFEYIRFTDFVNAFLDELTLWDITDSTFQTAHIQSGDIFPPLDERYLSATSAPPENNTASLPEPNNPDIAADRPSPLDYHKALLRSLLPDTTPDDIFEIIYTTIRKEYITQKHDKGFMTLTEDELHDFFRERVSARDTASAEKINQWLSGKEELSPETALELFSNYDFNARESLTGHNNNSKAERADSLPHDTVSASQEQASENIQPQHNQEQEQEQEQTSENIQPQHNQKSEQPAEENSSHRPRRTHRITQRLQEWKPVRMFRRWFKS